MRTARQLAVLVVVVAAANFIVEDRVWLRILLLTILWATAGVAWNFVGKAGQMSLGHSAFTGIGALVFVVLMREADISPWLGGLAGAGLAVVAAVLIGIPTLRLQGHYFTLATLAYPLILMLLAIHFGLTELTIPYHPDERLKYMQFGDAHAYVWLALGLLVLALGLSMATDASRFGHGLRAIRDNEVLARAIGFHTDRLKLAAFAVSAGLTALMAVLWANAVLLVVASEEVFGLGVIITIVTVTFVGGVGRTWGPVVGAALLVPLSQILIAEVGDQAPGAEYLVYGAALIAVALLAPEGVLARLERSGGGSAERGCAAEEPKRAAAPPSVAAPQTRRSHDDALLDVQGVRKRFRGVTVLDDVSFDVRADERVGLIGPNGAGKTTLFNLICGQLRPDAGLISFDGTDIGRMETPDRYRLGIARTFQVPQGFRRLTVHENVLLASVGRGIRHGGDRAATDMLEAVGLGDRVGAKLATLETLEVKLLELARSLVSRPSLLLLDEPLAGLSEPEQAEFFAVVNRLVPTGTGVLVIEHSVRSLSNFVDRLVALDEGTIVASGTPEQVTTDPRVIEAYLGRRWRVRPTPGEMPPSNPKGTVSVEGP